MSKPFLPRRGLAVGILTLTATLAACSTVQTTSSGAVGVDRKQYMSGLVSEQALQQEAQTQYNEIVSQAKAQGALDVNAARLSVA